MMMLMEQKAAAILQQLERHGYEAYFVGGFVRDKLANRPIHDIDLATEATPEVVMSIFSRTVPTGLKHGTVTVLEQGTPFEVTTFRQEQDYEHHRRPRSVSFVSDLEQDLKRRDFTINAMAMNRHGQLIDPFGGQADLERQLLRCVGRAEERFHEDALRMLRCVRFAAEYELEIEHETWQALLDLRHLTSHVAMERVRAEMERILEGSHPERGLPLLVQSRLPSHYKVDLPVTNQQWAKAAEFGIQLRLLLDADLRWHHFLWLLGLNQATGRQFLRKLTFSNERLVRITDLLALTSLWMGQNTLDRQAIHTLWIESIVSFGPKNGVKWLHWLRALQNDTLFSQQTGLTEFAFKMLITNGESWMRAMAATNLKELRIDGRLLHDTYSAARGPRIGQLLNQLLHEVALGKTKNETEILLARADQLLQTIMMNERQVE